MQQILKILLEFGPLAVFFFCNSQYGIFVATGAFMVATVVSLVGSWLLMRKIAVMPLITAVFVLVFGGLTLYLHDDLFMKLKPTIVNLMFAAILFGGLQFGRLFLKLVFEEAFKLSDEGWYKLTLRWSGFFVFLALLNELVWRSAGYYYSDPKAATDLWVAFKVWGVMPITMIFTIFQIGLIQKYAIEEKENQDIENK